MAIVTEAIITCPVCGESSLETMPTDACLWIYTCGSCGASSRPLEGDCCVFCSYSDQVCPSKQTGNRSAEPPTVRADDSGSATGRWVSASLGVVLGDTTREMPTNTLNAPDA